MKSLYTILEELPGGKALIERYRQMELTKEQFKLKSRTLIARRTKHLYQAELIAKNL